MTSTVVSAAAKENPQFVGLGGRRGVQNVRTKKTKQTPLGFVSPNTVRHRSISKNAEIAPKISFADTQTPPESSADSVQEVSRLRELNEMLLDRIKYQQNAADAELPSVEIDGYPGDRRLDAIRISAANTAAKLEALLDQAREVSQAELGEKQQLAAELVRVNDLLRANTKEIRSLEALCLKLEGESEAKASAEKKVAELQRSLLQLQSIQNNARGDDGAKRLQHLAFEKIKALQAELTTTKSQLLEATEKVAQLHAEAEQTRSQFTATANAHFQEASAEISAARTELSAARADLDGERQVVGSLREELTVVRGDRDQLAFELANQKEAVGALNRDLDRARELANTAKDAALRAAGAAKRAAKRAVGAGASAQAAETAAEEATREAQGSDEVKRLSFAKIIALQAEIESSRAREAEGASARSLLIGELERARTDMLLKEEALAALRAELRLRTSEAEEARRELGEAQAAAVQQEAHMKEELRWRLSAGQLESDALRSQVEDLKAALEAAEGGAAELRAQLTAREAALAEAKEGAAELRVRLRSKTQATIGLRKKLEGAEPAGISEALRRELEVARADLAESRRGVAEAVREATARVQDEGRAEMERAGEIGRAVLARAAKLHREELARASEAHASKLAELEGKYGAQAAEAARALLEKEAMLSAAHRAAKEAETRHEERLGEAEERGRRVSSKAAELLRASMTTKSAMEMFKSKVDVQLREADEERARLGEDLRARDDAVDALTAETDTLRAALGRAESSARARAADLARVGAELEASRGRAAAAEGVAQRLREALSSRESEVSHLEYAVASLEGEVQGFRAGAEEHPAAAPPSPALVEELAAARRALSALEGCMTAAEGVHAAREAELEAGWAAERERADVAECRARAAAAEEAVSLREAVRRAKELQGAVDQKTAALRHSKKERASLRKELAAATAEVAALRPQLGAAHEKIERLQAQVGQTPGHDLELELEVARGEANAAGGAALALSGLVVVMGVAAAAVSATC